MNGRASFKSHSGRQNHEQLNLLLVVFFVRVPGSGHEVRLGMGPRCHKPANGCMYIIFQKSNHEHLFVYSTLPVYSSAHLRV